MNLREKSDEVIRTHVMWAMGAGALPVPMLDLAAVTTVQLDMIRQLCQVYGVNFSKDIAKNLLASLVGAGLGRLGASLLKTIPGVGTILGGATQVITSGASTYAIGKVFAKQLADGKKLENFDVNKGKEQFEEEYQEGKNVAQDLEKNIKEKQEKAEKQETKEQKVEDSSSERKMSPQEIFEALQKLAELRDKGILSDEEFSTKKTQLLRQL